MSLNKYDTRLHVQGARNLSISGRENLKSHIVIHSFGSVLTRDIFNKFLALEDETDRMPVQACG
jgi:hypothetical protein